MNAHDDVSAGGCPHSLSLEVRGLAGSIGGENVRTAGAFTLVELLVTVAIISVLASLILPVLSKTREQNRRITCIYNLRQFGQAWVLYAGDHNDAVPPNNGGFPLPEGQQTWVTGFLSPYDNVPDNTNTAHLAQSLLSPYLGSSFGLWRCPSDFSAAREGGILLPRVRSYSMNSLLNCSFGLEQYLMQPFKVIRRTSDMVNPAPCDTFIILDEREDSIEDAFFVVDMWNGPASLADVPAAHHNGAANLVFGDNHVEPHRWVDPRTEPPIAQGAFVGIPWVPGPPNPDVLWIQTHATGLR